MRELSMNRNESRGGSLGWFELDHRTYELRAVFGLTEEKEAEGT